MYGDYIRERLGKEYMETAYGFVIYSFLSDAVYIEEVYTRPVVRFEGGASLMADEVCEIARQKGLKYVVGSVFPGAVASTASLKVLLAWKMRLWKIEHDLIYFIKDL